MLSPPNAAADLGALMVVEELKKRQQEVGPVIMAVGPSKGGVSGGTIASGMAIGEEVRAGGEGRLCPALTETGVMPLFKTPVRCQGPRLNARRFLNLRPMQIASNKESARLAEDPYCLIPPGAPRGASKDLWSTQYNAALQRWLAPFIMQVRALRLGVCVCSPMYRQGPPLEALHPPQEVAHSP